MKNHKIWWRWKWIIEISSNKSPMINDIDINKTVVSNNLPFGKQDYKYFNWLQRF